MTDALSLYGFEDRFAQDFFDINHAWIEEMFVVEPLDLQVLENPRREIIDKGGEILFVAHPDHGVVGTGALMPGDDGAVELTKMGVRTEARGLKAGERLLGALIDKGLEMGAAPLFLLTNTKCEAAIHLYEKAGFLHDAELLATRGARYERCDVAMLHPASSKS